MRQSAVLSDYNGLSKVSWYSFVGTSIWKDTIQEVITVMGSNFITGNGFGIENRVVMLNEITFELKIQCNLIYQTKK